MARFTSYLMLTALAAVAVTTPATADIIQDATNAAEDAANAIANAAKDAANAAGSWIDNAASNVEEFYHDAASAAEDAYQAAASAAKEACNQYNSDHSASLDCTESTASAAADAAATAAERPVWATITRRTARSTALRRLPAPLWKPATTTITPPTAPTIVPLSTLLQRRPRLTARAALLSHDCTVDQCDQWLCGRRFHHVPAPTHATPGFSAACVTAITFVGLLANFV
ncbi:hypothetical protein GQ600_26754 [Phytophthora cactorum]|nr:hypothetical protein GQ600_26754 [Phytophthora cactorum]